MPTKGVLGTLWKGGVIIGIAFLAFVLTPMLAGVITGLVGVRPPPFLLPLLGVLAAVFAVGWYDE